jgi:hypothetical protein
MEHSQKSLLRWAIELGVTTTVIWFMYHPDQIQNIRPWLQRATIKACRSQAEMWETLIVKLESAYRAGVANG